MTELMVVFFPVIGVTASAFVLGYVALWLADAIDSFLERW